MDHVCGDVLIFHAGNIACQSACPIIFIVYILRSFVVLFTFYPKTKSPAYKSRAKYLIQTDLVIAGRSYGCPFQIEYPNKAGSDMETAGI